MELDPRKNIESLARPVIRNTQRIGRMAFRSAEDVIGVFTNPRGATQNAESKILERKSVEELGWEVEAHVGDRDAQMEVVKQICEQTVFILRIPEAERTEDDHFDLKSAAYMFAQRPELMIGVGDLTDEDTRTLANFMTGLE
jgi:hypothetical protein